MRICYLADGTSIHTQRWVNYFAQGGHEVHLVCWRFSEGYAKGVQIHTLIRLLPQVWAVSQYLSAVLWLVQVRRLVDKIKPNILHAHFIIVYGYLGIVSGFHPLILTAWGSDVLIAPERRFYFKIFTKYALRRADLITCDGENTREKMIELGADPDKINLILHGVDTRSFSPAQKNEALREKLEIFDSPAIISVRSLEEVYDVESLVNAIPLVLEQVPSAKFIVVGVGSQRGYLRNLAASLGISDSIRFTGRLSNDEFPRYLASADVYVSTALSEGGTSVSLAEAMSCGLAPVVTDVGDSAKWIENGKNGFVVPTKSPALLAEKIIYLLRNKDLRKEFGEINRKIVEERASYEEEMGKMNKLYEELARRSQR